MKKKESIFNESGLKRYILKRCKELRPGWDPERISKSSLIQLENNFKRRLDSMIWRHPSIGKTFKQVM